MPRLLIKNKIRVALALFVVGMLVFAAISLSLGHVLFACLLLGAIPLFVALYLLNRRILRKNETIRSVFSLTPSSPRNFDYLVVGDLCNTENIVPKNSRSICFLAPERTTEASFLIFKHVFSLLKENGGNVVFVVNRKNLFSKRITLFDVSFLHQVTIKRLGLQSLLKKSRFPLIFSPLLSIKFLLCTLQRRKLRRESFPQTEIEEFCKERKISVDFFVFGA